MDIRVGRGRSPRGPWGTHGGGRGGRRALENATGTPVRALLVGGTGGGARGDGHGCRRRTNPDVPVVDRIAADVRLDLSITPRGIGPRARDLARGATQGTRRSPSSRRQTLSAGVPPMATVQRHAP